MSELIGLTSDEAKTRFDTDGTNIIDSRSENSAVRLLLRQFENPITLILFAATAISMFAGEVVDGVIILAIIIPSGLLGFWQERRAGQITGLLGSTLSVHASPSRS